MTSVINGHYNIVSRKKGKANSLITNPRSHRDAAPAHTANQAACQTLSSGSWVEVSRVVHGNGFRRDERLLTRTTAILVVC